MDGVLLASWAQALANTVVLFLIYLQIRQANTQMVQNDEQERWRRSWEFVKFYREELRAEDIALGDDKEEFEPLTSRVNSDAYKLHLRYFFKPRVTLYALLNQMVQHQEVDERMLFGYLSEDFNRFIEIGVTYYNLIEFRKEFGPQFNLLFQLWGSQIRSGRLLHGAAGIQSDNA